MGYNDTISSYQMFDVAQLAQFIQQFSSSTCQHEGYDETEVRTGLASSIMFICVSRWPFTASEAITHNVSGSCQYEHAPSRQHGLLQALQRHHSRSDRESCPANHAVLQLCLVTVLGSSVGSLTKTWCSYCSIGEPMPHFDVYICSNHCNAFGKAKKNILTSLQLGTLDMNRLVPQVHGH